MLPCRVSSRRQHHPRKKIEDRGRGHERSCGSTNPRFKCRQSVFQGLPGGLRTA